MKKSLLARFAFWARNIRYARLFKALADYCQGEVLDIGGRDFYREAKKKRYSL